ncbi:hypothetical protein Ctob_008647 [Chrysochromulina tobinii]|uniref:Uncharacterized protein n=1 Tax=Chrysochromulina tobinii TaxID=1460289 RepID=A0A0M0K432_9EUKA|nr:hypothetical protein Ctob_008647 [Chrysochromulina tobinii]|eukprot:KOO33575.1 hypothetical protein Ctob_008647 [Chrysochromulina sp. CCMP291]
MDKPWLQPISRSAPGEDMMGGLPECGDFKRGSCFRASCKFMHNGKPASEYQAEKGVTPGLPTPRAASHFEAPANLDLNLYDPNTGFGLFGTHVFGTRYGTIGAIPKIENVRPLCMDFFKQGVCNRRGPHNQGCLFRHDEIDGRGKIVDESMVMKVDQLQVDLFVSESSGGVGVWGKYARDDLADAAAAYAKQRELQLQAEAAGAKRREEEDAHAAEVAKAVLAAAATAGARADGAPAHAAAGAASTEAPLPEGWKATKAPDGRVYYFHAATKKTTWTRPVADPADAPPLPAGWKQATAPDGRTYYFIKGGYPPSGYPPSGYPGVHGPPPLAASPTAAAHDVGPLPLSAVVPAETDAAAPPAQEVKEEADPDEPEAKRAKVDE